MNAVRYDPIAQLPRRVFEGFGYPSRSVSVFLTPTSAEEVVAAYEHAQREGVHVALRGSGRSYGDAAMNGGHLVLDMTHMRRILSWNAEAGILDAEPGVTIEDVWRTCLKDGWWPAVSPGTMFPTLGGCAAMNIHGKNHYRVGGIGDHILEVDVVLPTGEALTLSRTQHPELFHAFIGGFGMLGTFTRIRMKLKHVSGGRLRVRQLPARDLDEQFAIFDEQEKTSDYLVSWVDCIVGGPGLGRGQVHRAEYTKPGEDPEGQVTLDPAKQDLPGHILGVPRSLVGTIIGLFNFNLGMRLLNEGKYLSSRFGSTRDYYQPHVAFHYLLDYVPTFRGAYAPHGFIQYQPFLPKETAKEALREILRLNQARGIVSYLGVLKRYRPDDFLLSHALDGYSLAMDFPITAQNREGLWKMCGEMSEIVLDAGGRFYPAKDAVLRPQDVRRAWGQERLSQFQALRRRCDPQGLLRTEWAERVGVDDAG